jgi:Zn-dependent M16 (insulinase) family peptidase
MDTSIGAKLFGFVVRRVTPVDLLSSLAIELEHEDTGLRVLHVHNDDIENLFSITFPTPPADDTGVPHILEHSVLAGSHKYPAREGFFELVKRSLGTFINAMTADEHTLYPVASSVPKDLFNLADVYWDAVFHPLLTEHTFQREGHRLELAAPGDPSSELVIKGIVHSEMQGVYSGAESLIHQALDQGLFPENPYGRDAGGDPDAIPALTYQGLLAFHRRHYQPAQALVVVYGNLPTERYLEFVAERLRGEWERSMPIQVEREPRWQAPRRRSLTCPVPSSDAGRAWIVLGWIAGNGTDPEDVMELYLLERLLVGHPGAVLRKAILDAKVGDDLALTYCNGKRLDATFSVGVRGADPARADEFVEVVLGTLRKLVEHGIEREAIETACQQLAYATLEIGDLFPVHLLWKISTQYVLTGDPIPVLRSAEHLRAARDRALGSPDHLAKLLRERLLENPHRLLVVATGDPDHARRREEAALERLRARKASLSGADLDRLAAQAAEFDRLEQQPEDLGAYERLPKLTVGDLPRRPRTIPTVFESDGRLDFLDNQVFANGINYLHLDFDLGHLDPGLLSYLGLFTQCLRKLGTRGRGWAETAARVAATTSGVSGWAQLDAHATDPTRTIRSLRVATSFLDGRAEDALGVLEELLFELDFADRIRLGDILVQTRASQRAHIASRASSLARCNAARPLSPEAWLTDESHGLAQIRLLERLAAGFAANQGELIQETVDKLTRIRAALATAPRLAVSFTGSKSERAAVRRRVASFADRAPAAATVPVAWDPPRLPKAVGLAAPMDVAFAAYVVPGPHYTDPALGALQVASTHFRQEYVLEEIRLRGAAYGAWCATDPLHRYFELGSYRDPQIARTVGIFRHAADGIQRIGWSPAEIERAILVTAKDSLKPNRPGEATGTALFWYVHGLDDDLRQQRYENLLAVEPTRARETLLQVLAEGSAGASLCVVSSRDKLAAANTELAAGGLEIEDIFE